MTLCSMEEVFASKKPENCTIIALFVRLKTSGLCKNLRKKILDFTVFEARMFANSRARLIIRLLMNNNNKN